MYKRQIYSVMLFAFLVGVCINVSQEMGGNPRIDEMGIAQDNGAMEGKEVRFGSAATALWSIVTTVTSNGSVHGCLLYTSPLSSKAAEGLSECMPHAATSLSNPHTSRMQTCLLYTSVWHA